MEDNIEILEETETFSITEEQFNDLYAMQEIQSISLCMIVGLIIVILFTRKF